MTSRTRLRRPYERRHSPAVLNQAGDSSIVVLDRFIQATRDSGYKGTASAVSELVDNAIQAKASDVEISLLPSDDEGGIEVRVLDNGCGMDPLTLRQALRFGGSTRFGYRTGLGRYGMGLPNASLSQARHLAVYTWQSPSSQARRRSICVYTCYLDVDDIVTGRMKEVPTPKVAVEQPCRIRTASGTLIVWKRCDRLDNRRISTLARKLGVELGRRFRHFIWSGLRIRINGQRVTPFDPLYLHPAASIAGAKMFGEELIYEVRAKPADATLTGQVRVRFSELPVHRWHKLSNEDKRRMGISKGAGVSIVRAGREVDFGWFFMGSKRRENYDDWWRCEVQFDPVLDEAFGITHTKQQIRPQAHLLEALTPDLEASARALNARARKAHFAAKMREQYSEAERVAADRDHLLRPLPVKPPATGKALMRELEKAFPILSCDVSGGLCYRIVEGAAANTCFFTYAFDGKRLVLVVNPEHPFYREIYGPLAQNDSAPSPKLRAKIDLLLLAAARSEAASTEVRALARHRLDWSNTLATYLNNHNQ